MLFDTKSTHTAQASLDSLWIKTQVIANNLANVDTPGFKASNVTFEQELNRAAREIQNKNGQDVSQGAGGGSGRFAARVTTDNTSDVRQDGNNVSLEREQTELWKTYAQYSYLLDRISGHYSSINGAISGMRT